MDHTKGFQIPPGILPEVTMLAPGLALLFHSTRLDVRTLEKGLQFLIDGLYPLGVYPAFVEIDTSKEKLEYVLGRLDRMRKEALENNRVIFACTPLFEPRRTTLSEQAEHVFHLLDHLGGACLITDKCNGQPMGSPLPGLRTFLYLPPPRMAPPARKVVGMALPVGMTPEVAQEVLERYQEEQDRKKNARLFGYIFRGNHTTRLLDDIDFTRGHQAIAEILEVVDKELMDYGHDLTVGFKKSGEEIFAYVSEYEQPYEEYLSNLRTKLTTFFTQQGLIHESA
ncbi:hypothetical protein LUCX_234 [Xanthomonas phage vB_XciM_LucasX]|nr:hypothetical protein LUCX_234 [Xanthomonas phage vB_XciM_LucasX]